MDYEKIAKDFGTPLYIYNFDEVGKRYDKLKDSFSARKSLICYAVKANSNLSLLKYLANLGSGFDCVSINEVKRALLAGASKYKIIFSGVGKSDFEIKQALKYEILFINVESKEELFNIEKIAKSLNKPARISVRVNPNVDAKTHPYISTGLKDNKFGVSIDEARTMYLYAKNSNLLEPIAIHFHIGSQLTDISPIKEACEIVSNFMSELIAAEIDIKFFDVGGGIGVKYNNESEINLYNYSQTILASLKGQDKTIIIEPGRFLTANSGELLTSVIYEKINEGKRFVIVDAAMNDLIRPSLYNSHHKVVHFKGDLELSTCDVVGPICESGDFLAKNILLPKFKKGELISIKDSGAYGFSMSSNYNSRPFCAEIAIINGEIKQIRKRQTFEDLISLEKEFL